MDFDISSSFSSSTKKKRSLEEIKEEEEEDELDELSEMIAYKKPRKNESKEEEEEVKTSQPPPSSSLSSEVMVIESSSEGGDLTRYSAIPSDTSSQSRKYDSFSSISPKAKEYKFELDIFQKQSILHIENEESVLVAAHTSGFYIFIYKLCD